MYILYIYGKENIERKKLATIHIIIKYSYRADETLIITKKNLSIKQIRFSGWFTKYNSTVLYSRDILITR